jgi:hypothetical protein
MSIVIDFIKNNELIIGQDICTLLLDSRTSKIVRQACFQQYKLTACEFYKELFLWASIDPIYMKVEQDVYFRLNNKIKLL